MLRLILLAVLFAFAVPSAAADKPKPVKEKKVCRTELETGSIMMHTKCATPEEWADIDAANRRGAEHALGRDGVGSGGNAAEKGFLPK